MLSVTIPLQHPERRHGINRISGGRDLNTWSYRVRLSRCILTKMCEIFACPLKSQKSGLATDLLLTFSIARISVKNPCIDLCTTVHHEKISERRGCRKAGTDTARTAEPLSTLCSASPCWPPWSAPHPARRASSARSIAFSRAARPVSSVWARTCATARSTCSCMVW